MSFAEEDSNINGTRLQSHTATRKKVRLIDGMVPATRKVECSLHGKYRTARNMKYDAEAESWSCKPTSRCQQKRDSVAKSEEDEADVVSDREDESINNIHVEEAFPITHIATTKPATAHFGPSNANVSASPLPPSQQHEQQRQQPTLPIVSPMQTFAPPVQPSSALPSRQLVQVVPFPMHMQPPPTFSTLQPTLLFAQPWPTAVVPHGFQPQYAVQQQQQQQPGPIFYY